MIKSSILFKTNINFMISFLIYETNMNENTFYNDAIIEIKNFTIIVFIIVFLSNFFFRKSKCFKLLLIRRSKINISKDERFRKLIFDYKNQFLFDINLTNALNV